MMDNFDNCAANHGTFYVCKRNGVQMTTLYGLQLLQAAPIVHTANNEGNDVLTNGTII